MLDYTNTSPAAETNSPAVRISPVRWATAVHLKSWLPEHRRGTDPITLAGLSWPRHVGATLSGSMDILCLAPGEWLLLANKHSADVKAQLQLALRQQGVALADWSAGFVTFRVEGRMVRSLLAKGCGLDLDRHAFPQGRCARTRFAQIPVVLHCLDETLFDLLVAGSYSDYLQEWLNDAAVEWDHLASA